MPKPNPGVFWAKFRLVLFSMHAAGTLVLLRGAFGPLMGHCVLKIDKTAAYLTSELDL
jgi:hypothetical protein